MILKIFAIYDNAIKAYANPFYMHTTEEAIRTVKREALSNDSKLAAYPTDFTLFELGTYSTETGFITMDELTRLGNMQELTRDIEDKLELKTVEG